MVKGNARRRDTDTGSVAHFPALHSLTFSVRPPSERSPISWPREKGRKVPSSLPDALYPALNIYRQIHMRGHLCHADVVLGRLNTVPYRCPAEQLMSS